MIIYQIFLVNHFTDYYITDEPIEGKTATLIGWGFNATIHQIIPYFYETTVKVLNTEECRRIVPQTKFCASGINSMDSLMQVFILLLFYKLDVIFIQRQHHSERVLF